VLQSSQPRLNTLEEIINDHIRQVPLTNGVRLALVHGDITRVPVDAIVNAANARLQHGGGVAGAIVRSGGMVIQRESNEWVREHGPISAERPALTSAGDLPCRRVIHAVGPVWGEGDEDHKLSIAVRAALQLAEEQGFSSVAFPAISTGIFGFPKGRAAQVIYSSFCAYAAQNPNPALKEIWLVIWDEASLAIFTQAFDLQWPRDKP
jgi:O-acetyl-ADP-ribose deacetylase (regulator of RNase III)